MSGWLGVRVPHCVLFMVGASGKRYNPTAWDATQDCEKNGSSPLPANSLISGLE